MDLLVDGVHFKSAFSREQPAGHPLFGSILEEAPLFKDI